MRAHQGVQAKVAAALQNIDADFVQMSHLLAVLNARDGTWMRTHCSAAMRALGWRPERARVGGRMRVSHWRRPRSGNHPPHVGHPQA